MESNVEKLTIEEFESLRSRRRGGRKNTSWQALAIEKMDIGTALRLNHEGIAHNSNGCGFRGLRRRLEGVYPDRFYSVAHDAEGNALVACFGKGEQ